GIMRVMRSAERYAPFAIFLAGAGYTLYLQTLVPDEIFYSLDGGVKFLLTRQIAERGLHDLRVDLDLQADPWVRDLWNDGFYPLEEPIVYRHADRWYMQYPPFFAYASAPFYRLLGFHGLYVIPLIATWLLWLVFYAALRKARVDRGRACLALLIL